ncbi:MAG: hypothetical protein KDI06_03845 [Calditrichaeota bacterium]|nr:hypothetical protein [Calditrichota bacterium]HQU71487.1 hypothetical protein [Calditrichia bacterium]
MKGAAESRHLVQKSVFAGFFGLIAIGFISWSVHSVSVFHTQFSSAAVVAGEMGALMQKAAAHLNLLKDPTSRDNFEEHLRSLRSLAYTISLKHKSLFQGNPRLDLEETVAGDIKAIYRQSPGSPAEQVQTFLANSRFLSGLQPRDMLIHEEQLAALQNQVRNGLIFVVTDLIHSYRMERDERVIRTTIVLATSLLLLLVGGSLLYVMIFSPQTLEKRFVPAMVPDYQRHRDFKPDVSIAPVLNGLSHFSLDEPVSQESENATPVYRSKF